jgi:hypothetical protein
LLQILLQHPAAACTAPGTRYCIAFSLLLLLLSLLLLGIPAARQEHR